MAATDPKRSRFRPAWVAMAAGTGLVAFAILVDVLPGGSAGFGVKQWGLTLAGLALLLAGARAEPATWARMRRTVAVGTDEAVLDAARIGVLAVLFACATALAEGVVLAASAVLFGVMHRLGPHVVWMSALANLLVLVLAGFALWLLGTVWPKARSAWVVAFAFALLGADAVVHRLPDPGRAQAWSKWLLAAGLAVVVARALAAAARHRWPRVLRLTAATVAVLALVTAVTFGRGPVAERLAHAGLPDAAPEAPGILMIILDTVRAASLGLYGYERPTTPNLERLAATAAVFDRAIAPSSWTLPSHATLFTGRYPNELSADWRVRLDDAYPTLAEVLADRGYATAAFSANGAYVNAGTGLERGFARFEDHPVRLDEVVRTAVMFRRMVERFGRGDMLRDGYAGRKSAADIADAFLRWQSRQRAGRPFFAMLNLFDAHDPYIAPAPFDTLFGRSRELPPLDWGRPASPELVTAWTDGYDRAIAYIDFELGRLFDTLGARGILDQTIIVITADHGEHLGEHGYMRHGNTLYMPVIHVPLLVRYPPAVPGGVRVAEPVTLRDVPATVLDLAGADGGGLAGASLVGAWNGAGAPSSVLYAEVRRALRVPERYPNSDADVQSLVTGDMHYIRVTDGREELYRYADDPDEVRDLAGADVPAAEVGWLRGMLNRHLAAHAAEGGVTAARR